MRHATQVLMDTAATASATIRRAILVRRENGLPHELAVAFLYRQHPCAALNTHLAVLQDLSFFFEWCELKHERDPQWAAPERRASAGHVVLSSREITDFARWCSYPAARLTAALKRADGESTPSDLEAVDSQTHNRRLNTAAEYLTWILKERAPNQGQELDFHLKLDLAAQKIRDNFRRHLHAAKKAPLLRSLEESRAAQVQHLLDDVLPESTPTERRDKLICRLLFHSGIRSGELLKLQCIDISDEFQVGQGRLSGCIEIHLRPNDRHDTRRIEPAAKTIPGSVPILRELAQKLVDYIINDREAAVLQSGGPMHPYLFVSHKGVTAGKPISQRNLNRLIAKLRRYPGMPQDFCPYVLRHTHLNTVYDTAQRNGKNGREILLQRARWSNKSEMPQRYAQRSIARQAAELVAMRERQIGSAR